MANKLKTILINIFGDGFLGLEREDQTQKEITNGYRTFYTKTCNTPQTFSCRTVEPNFIGSCMDTYVPTSRTTASPHDYSHQE